MRMIASAATLLAAATLLCACQPKAAPPPATTAETQVTTEEDKALYALGALISQNLQGFQLTPKELDLVKLGLTDGVTHQTLQVDTDKYRQQVEQLHQTRMAAAGKVE